MVCSNKQQLVIVAAGVYDMSCRMSPVTELNNILQWLHSWTIDSSKSEHPFFHRNMKSISKRVKVEVQRYNTA